MGNESNGPIYGTIAAIAAVCCVFIFALDSCATRNHQFRVACITKGGTVIDRGSTQDCLVGVRGEKATP